MDESDITNLDTEFKRYLQIMRPYLSQLLDQDIIEICNAWIQKLSKCTDEEKSMRNRYIFTLCYQLAKGILDEPFLKAPSDGFLAPLSEDINSDDSSSEIECLVIDRENTNTKTLYRNSKAPLSIRDDEEQSFSDAHTNSTQNIMKPGESCFHENESKSKTLKPTTFCRASPVFNDQSDVSYDKYKYRINNLVTKLRLIKQENMILHAELNALKEESKAQIDDSQNYLKVNTATSTNISVQNSHTNLKILTEKLHEVQQSKNALLETISQLQETLNFFHSMKRHEIQELIGKHNRKIVNVKTATREEITKAKDLELDECKLKYDNIIKKLKSDHENELRQDKEEYERIVSEKDAIIQNKEREIAELKKQIDEIKRNQLDTINKILLDKPDVSESSSLKTEELERRINKMEKSKYKSTRAYELKLAQLQRQKHLAECALQLQLMKQRTQVMNEVVDENQVEMTAALDKLEGKYKEIVANVQATAVQRRMQDQLALESIVQAICGTRDKYANLQGSSQLGSKTMRNPNKNVTQSCDMELSTLLNGNKVGNVIVGKSFGDDSVVSEYCLDREKLGELFERVHIPQRDVGESLTKK